MVNSKPNTSQQNIKGWIVVICGALFYMYQFMIRVSPNIMNEELLYQFAIDSPQLRKTITVKNNKVSADLKSIVKNMKAGQKFYI